MNEITDKEFAILRNYIKNNFGISLGEEKKSLVYSRLKSILQQNGMSNFTEYYDYLIKDKSGDAVADFIDKITTNHTFFMRETDHFDYFRDTVLPFVETTYGNNKDLRLWCAGCSSGEEAYTLQMIVKDYFKGKIWNTQILATDISTTVLTKAIQGAYTGESVNTLPKKWVFDYFRKIDNDNYIVKDEIKKDIVYRKFNLMEEKFPFNDNFQVIFCRNVMIYFDNDTRNALVEKYYNLTIQGGYLFIGHSESLNHSGTKYKYVKPAVYRKT